MEGQSPCLARGSEPCGVELRMTSGRPLCLTMLSMMGVILGVDVTVAVHKTGGVDLLGLRLDAFKRHL